MQEQSSGLQHSISYAGFGPRLVAWFIDYAITFVSGLVVTFLIAIIAGPFAIIGLFLGFVVSSAYFAGFESSSLQATPGKMAMGLKVTDINGERLNLSRALARNWAMAVSNATFGIGYLMIFKTGKRQALHDKIANCLVVRTAKVLGCGDTHETKVPQ